jgi:pimeloyl-ACP methyl ester carboxylesterase
MNEGTVTRLATQPNIAELAFPTSRDAGELANYLRQAHAAGITVDFRRADKRLWGLALNYLLSHPFIEVAEAMAPRMAVTFPEVRFFGTIAGLFERLPPPSEDAVFAAFRDDMTAEVQVVPRAGANCVLLGFAGRSQKLGMPINLIHRWFGLLGVHVIYLRDYTGHNYDQGIRALSSDMHGTLKALRQIIANLGVNRIACYGNSMGGYGTLRYALELEAEAVLSFAGPTNLVRGFGDFTVLQQRDVEPGLDLRPLYENARYAPRVHLVYGEHHAFDRAQATNFLGLPTVTLEMIPGWRGHDVFLQTVFTGRYERLIRWLADASRTAGRP